MVINYQWIVLKKNLRVITLNMVFSKVITLPMVSLTRHEESITAWLWHMFKKCMISFQTILFHNLSLTIAHCFFFAKKLSKLCFQNFVFLQVEILQKTKVCYLFFLLPLAKRFKGLTVWEFFWFFLFSLNKRFQMTNYLRYLLFSLTKIQGTNRLKILCLNTLEGTSFVVQVEGISTWVITENKRGYISCGSVQVEGTSNWLFKENKGGYIPCGSLLVRDFTRLLEISRTGGCLGTGRRHGLWLN